MQMTFYKIEHANLYICTYSFTCIYTHVYSKNQLQTDRCQLKSCSRIFLTKLPVKCVLWNFHYVEGITLLFYRKGYKGLINKYI